jgi:hypothetical protein
MERREKGRKHMEDAWEKYRIVTSVYDVFGKGSQALLQHYVSSAEGGCTYFSDLLSKSAKASAT